MIGCDTNILIYAFDITSPFHTKSRDFLHNESQQSYKLVFTAQVFLEFFRITTQKIPKPVSPEQAQRAINSVARNPNIVVITPPAAAYDLAIISAVNNKESGAAIFDHYLAMTLHDYNIDTIATKNIKHFSSFPALTAMDPTI